ncbi:MAG: hypothetical protein LUD50_02420 [Clostridia bacterium]|nr:hypothetical protein [Clostridia bacterium]
MSKRRYDPVYIQEAIKLADDIGVREAAGQLGIPVSTLSYWGVGKSARQAGKPDTGDSKDRKIKEQAGQIKELTEASDQKDQTIAELQKQIDILKATVSYFGLDHKE